MATLILNGNWGSPYTKLEYIENISNAYIDTGIKGNMSYIYEFKFKKNIARDMRMWGCWTNDYIGPNMSLTWTSGVILRWEHEEGKYRQVDVGPNDLNDHKVLINNGSIYYDNIYKGKSGGHKDNYTFPINLYIFKMNRIKLGTYPNEYNLIGRYYYYSVKNQQEQLLQHLIPVRRNSDGEVGVFDIVTRHFLTSPNGTKFIAGPKLIE